MSLTPYEQQARVKEFLTEVGTNPMIVDFMAVMACFHDNIHTLVDEEDVAEQLQTLRDRFHRIKSIVYGKLMAMCSGSGDLSDVAKGFRLLSVFDEVFECQVTETEYPSHILPIFAKSMDIRNITYLYIRDTQK